MLPPKICFVDLETTGMSTRHDRIIEIGMVRVENNQITREFQSLINPGAHIPHEIEHLTGITAQKLMDSPSFAELHSSVLEMLEGCIFVAHNVRFDYGFLKTEFERIGLSFSPKHFCTVRLSRLLYPSEKRHNLDAIIARCNLACSNRHRAFDDAKVLYFFFQQALQKFPESTIEEAIKIISKRVSLPPQLKQTDIDALPKSAGVYIFYGQQESPLSHDNFKEDIPLYIGKSKNLRERVLSHFSSDIRSSVEMKLAQQVAYIKTHQTSGELGALLLESNLIKEKMPLYNKLLRHKSELSTLIQDVSASGYHTAIIKSVKTASLPSLGFFRSKRLAKEYLIKVTKEYNLCQKLLGLEKTTTSCFAYRLGICQGACIGKESTLHYNLRFVAAFAKEKIKPWPFPGAIAIIERDETEEKSDYFILNNWSYIGQASYREDYLYSKKVDTSPLFDLDIYKIILRFLKDPQNMKKIKQLSSSELEAILH